MADAVSKSWFAMLANPNEHGYSGTPEAVCAQLRDEWVNGSTTRSGAWAYCISAQGLHHVHMVLEDAVAMRFSRIIGTYAPGTHLEATKGSKKQAEDYIEKKPPYDEKGETVVCIVKHGEIRANQGKRSDLEQINNMLEAGYNPSEILFQNFSFFKYERQIKAAYFLKRKKETPPVRDVKVHFLLGKSRQGKSYHYVQLCEKLGDENVCIVTDYTTAAFDGYFGQPILFLDEFKGQFSYDKLLILLDKYRVPIHARFSNAESLWDEVYITTIYGPEELYQIMVPPALRHRDTIDQLFGRITDITYCWRSTDGEYHTYTISADEYVNIEHLRDKALRSTTQPLPF